MRKSILAMTLLVLMLVPLFVGCASKTPDVVAAENAMTLEKLDWSFEVEGGSKTTYTLADAKAHEMSKVIVSMFTRYPEGYVDPNLIEGTNVSWLAEGIKFTEFLEDVGAADATRVTWYGNDAYGEEVSGVLEGDLLKDEKNVLIGWVKNKEEVLPNRSKTYVGIFGSTALTDFVSCCSLYKIVIE